MNKNLIQILLLFSLITTNYSCQSINDGIKDQQIDLAEETENSNYQLNFSNEYYRVTKVIDGDTFWCINNNDEKFKIRLIGIDAPESRNVFKKKKQPFGKAASKYVKNLLSNTLIKLEFDIDSQDQYGRTLAYVYSEDGVFINEKIIKDGYAILMTIAPNIKYETIFFEAQQFARENELGIWSELIVD